MEPERESGQILCKGGIMIKKADDVDAYVQALRQLTARPQELVRMGQANASRAAQFGSERVQETMKMIYEIGGGIMDFSKLNYAMTIVEYQSISKVAKKLHMTQPALTRSLNHLENELG